MLSSIPSNAWKRLTSLKNMSWLGRDQVLNRFGKMGMGGGGTLVTTPCQSLLKILGLLSASTTKLAVLIRSPDLDPDTWKTRLLLLFLDGECSENASLRRLLVNCATDVNKEPPKLGSGRKTFPQREQPGR